MHYGIINNILIVEDEWISADFLSDLVLSLGHNVIGIAKSAKDALEILSSNPCDLIFMDINIKGVIDGIQLAKQLNRTENRQLMRQVRRIFMGLLLNRLILAILRLF